MYIVYIIEHTYYQNYASFLTYIILLIIIQWHKHCIVFNLQISKLNYRDMKLLVFT